MKMRHFLLAALMALASASPALSLDRYLQTPRIKDNGDVRLSDDLKIGRFQGKKYIATPDSLDIQGPGSTGPIDDMNVTMPGVGGIARAISAKLRDLPVYPQDYGAKCDGGSDDREAYQKAADVATATGRALHVGGQNLCVLNGTINLTKAIPIIGDGQTSSILVGLHNGPIFTWTANGTDESRFVVRDFTLRGQYGASADYSASRGFLIQGDADHWFQIGHFENITFEGFYAGFEVTKGTLTTSFGQESRVAWVGFNNLTFRPGSRAAMYGWIWRNGSGTGHTFAGIRSFLGTNGSLLRFEGQGAVVGDIVITGGHFGGTIGTKLVSVAPGTVYRSNIMVSGSQLDAGMDVPFDFSADTPVFRSILFAGNNVGGGVRVNMPPARFSIVDDQLVSSWRSGKEFNGGAAGAQNIPVFDVTLGGASSYTGTECSVTAAGLVAGIAGGVTRSSFLIGRSGSTLSIVPNGSPVSTSSAPGFFTINAAQSGGTSKVTFSIGFTASDGGSQFESQIKCSTGEFSVLSR